MEEAINEHLMIIDALNARMRKPAPTRWRAISMPWRRKSIFLAQSGKSALLTATAAPHPAALPLFAHFPLSGFLSFPSSRFYAALPQSSPMRDDPRLRGPKVLFDANALKETVDVSTARKGDFPLQRNFLPIENPHGPHVMERQA